MKKCINNSKKIFMMINTFMIVLLFGIIFKNNAFAETLKYTFKLGNEQYVIVAQLSTDNKYVDIKNKLNNITFHHGGIINQYSFYNVIRERYEEHFRYYKATDSYIEDSKAEANAQLLLDMLELYMRDSERIDNPNESCCIEYLYKSGDKKRILNATKLGVTYGNKYDEIIKKIKNKSDIDDGDDDNPFFRDVYAKYSNYVVYADTKIEDLYTDEELLLMLARLEDTRLVDAKAKLSLTVETVADGAYASNEDYAKLRKTPSKTYVDIFDPTNTLIETFLIADGGVERLYGNSSTVTNYVDIKDNELRIINGKPATYSDTYLMYYTSSMATIDTQKKYVVMNDVKNGMINVYSVDSTNNNRLKRIAGIKKEVQYNEIRYDINTNWNVKYNNSDDSQGFFYIYYEVEDPSTHVKSNDLKYIIGINNWSMCFIDGDKYFDLIMPIIDKVNNETHQGVSLVQGTLGGFVYTDTKIQKDYTSGNSEYLATGEMLNKIEDYNSNVYLGIFENISGGFNMGSTAGEPLDMSNYGIHSENGTKIVFSIKPLLLIDANMVEKLKKYQDMQMAMITGTYDDNLVDQVNYSNVVERMEELIKVLKPILMIIILFFLIITGITGIVESKKPDARAEMIEKYKNIFLGVLFFACATVILTVIIKYVKISLERYEVPAEMEAILAQMQNDNDYKSGNILIGLIDLCLDVSTFVMNIVNNVCARILSGTGQSIDVIKLIYNVREGTEISRNMPFDSNGVEWTRYMTGYKALVSVGVLVMIIAVMKMSIEYMLFAGDDKKVMEIKKTFERIVIACLIIILTPYGVKLLIYVFNILTSLLPVNYLSANFELSFPYTGILRTIINFTYVSMKFKIYFVFLIRKVMISLLLVSTPIVAATWAISEKFESISIWIGELITNIALQFAYACGFMVLIIMSYSGQSNEVGLILMIVSMQLSKFIKDSMQGFFNEWGGFDEEGMADEMAQKVQEARQKFTGAIKRVGGALVSASKALDKDQKTNIGRRASNAGNLMQGNIFEIKTRADTINGLNRSGKVEGTRSEYMNAKEVYDTERKAVTDPNMAQELDYLKDNWKTLDKKKQEDIKKKGGAYSALASMKEKEKVWHSKLLEQEAVQQEYDTLRKKGAINRLKTYGARSSDKELDEAYLSNKDMEASESTKVDIDIDTAKQYSRQNLAMIRGGQSVERYDRPYDKDSSNESMSALIPQPIAEEFRRIDEECVEKRTTQSAITIDKHETMQKKNAVKQHFDGQFDLIKALLNDSQKLYKGDNSELIRELFNNYANQKQELRKFVEEDVDKEIEMQRDAINSMIRSRRSVGRYDLNTTDEDKEFAKEIRIKVD